MKVGVVGCGYVGGSAAFAMVLRGVANEIVLVDLNAALARAQAEDILHAVPFGTPVRVIDGNYSALQGASAVVLACGVNQKPGETRLQLLARNGEIFRSVIPQVLAHAPDAILVVASNPVDLITEIVTRISGLSPARVIGSGTILDTARFRALLGEHLGIAPQSVHAYVLGEHGDSEVLVWSSAKAAGVPIEIFASQSGKLMSVETKSQIDEKVRRAAYRIIEGKKATHYGIGAGLASVIKAIRDDERVVLTLSSLNTSSPKFARACFSLPRVLGAQGILTTIEPALDAQESIALQRSVAILHAAAKDLGH
jgi:L-lactate dehydrogenase